MIGPVDSSVVVVRIEADLTADLDGLDGVVLLD